jgi:transcriptional accessory protein Tex/SPT6
MTLVQPCRLLASLALLLLFPLAKSFTPPSRRRHTARWLVSSSRFVAGINKNNKNNKKVGENVRIVFDGDKVGGGEEEAEDDASRKRRRARWEQLDPKYKQYLIQKGQERAIHNKKKREPTMDQKRKLLNFVKEQQRDKQKQHQQQRDIRIRRPVLPQDRKPLQDFLPSVGSSEQQQQYEGIVISLTNFGAYVDIGAQECDGLLHISQLSTTGFVTHPRQLLTPGQQITVRIRSMNPQLKKLHLTMLPLQVLEAEQQQLDNNSDDNNDDDDRISLDQMQVDDELWGEIKRVTDFGAYVEVGAKVDGWLHFMDHPTWDGKAHPTQFMTCGDRIRVWVASVDRSPKNRIKLTANRPTHLPGPRREFR